jgi:hypothetical protein
VLTKEEILLFDIFGSYAGSLPVSAQSMLQVSGKNIVFMQKGLLNITADPLYDVAAYAVPLPGSRQLQLQGDVLFIRTDDGVCAYRRSD